MGCGMGAGNGHPTLRRMHGRGGLDGGWRLAGLAAALALRRGAATAAGRPCRSAWAAGLALAGAVAAWVLRRWMPLSALALAVAGVRRTDWRASAGWPTAWPAALEGRDLAIDRPHLRPAAGHAQRYTFRCSPSSMPRRRACRRGCRWSGCRGPIPARQVWAPGPNPSRANAGPSRCACGSRTAASTRMASTSSCGCSSAACAPAAMCAPVRPRRRAGWRLPKAPGSIGCASTCARAIEARVAEPRSAGVLAALAVGDQAAIERDDWDLFRDTGIAHLMSISGLHVTMFAWLAALLIGRAWRRSTRLMLCLPGAAGGALGRAGCWPLPTPLLAGWGVPAQRTLCMLAVVVALRSAGLRWPGPLVLLVAAVAVTAVRPLGPAAAGVLAVLWRRRPADAVAAPAAPRRDARPAGAAAWRTALRVGLRTQAVATRRAGAADAAVLPAGVAGRVLSPTWSRSRW